MKKFDPTLFDKEFAPIGAVSDALNRIREIKTIIGDRMEEVSLLFRGHADKNWSLEPGIYRNGYNQKEQFLLTELERYCPEDFDSLDKSFDKLVKAQHYELPTRLLDLSENVLAALYFAVSSEAKKTGELIIFIVYKSDIMTYSSARVNQIARSSYIPSDILDVGSDSYRLAKLNDNMAETGEYIAPITHINNINEVLCVLPRQNNPRIIRQQGAFFLFGLQGGKKEIMSNLEVTSIRINITAKKKNDILDGLKLAGITERFLFPEIDKVAHYLRNL